MLKDSQAHKRDFQILNHIQQNKNPLLRPQMQPVINDICCDKVEKKLRFTEI